MSSNETIQLATDVANGCSIHTLTVCGSVSGSEAEQADAIAQVEALGYVLEASHEYKGLPGTRQVVFRKEQGSRELRQTAART